MDEFREKAADYFTRELGFPLLTYDRFSESNVKLLGEIFFGAFPQSSI